MVGGYYTYISLADQWQESPYYPPEFTWLIFGTLFVLVYGTVQSATLLLAFIVFSIKKIKALIKG